MQPADSLSYEDGAVVWGGCGGQSLQVGVPEESGTERTWEIYGSLLHCRGTCKKLPQARQPSRGPEGAHAGSRPDRLMTPRAPGRKDRVTPQMHAAPVPLTTPKTGT